jgi:predicted PurR-regulated permease PerM
MAYLFSPVHDYFIKKGKSQATSAVYTFIISMLAIIIPMSIVLAITVLQINSLVDKIAAGNYSVDTAGLVNNLITSFNDFMAKLGINYSISVQELATNVSAAAEAFGKALVEGLLSSLTGFFSLITTSIIYIYVFLSMIRYKLKIIDTIKMLNPLGDEISDLYLSRVGAMTKATVKGQFIIAFMQGFTSAFVLTAVGLHGLFFFFLMLLTVMSLIPLGAGIITIPLGIIMILTGHVWEGVVVIANHLIIVTNIDNIMRPKLVPQSARLDPALMILAVFAGMALFGFIGIVIGPVIMILLMTTLQIFLEVFHSIESINTGKNAKHKGLISGIKKRFGLSKTVKE